MRIRVRGAALLQWAIWAMTGLVATSQLSAQAIHHTTIGLAAGAVAQPGYSSAPGALVSLTLTRYLPSRTALRVEAEYQWFGARQDVVGYPPCPSGLVCALPLAATAVSMRTGGVLASLEWYARTSRAGFYVLAGAGPQFILYHPHLPHPVRVAVQAGAGLAVPIGSAALLLEARYQRNHLLAGKES
jgi:hypothetical protein